MREKIKVMLEMQKKLDESVFKQHNTKFNLEKARIALLDEIGEMTHELKGDWCWWKNTQESVNRKRVLEELVDVWHFALMIEYHNGSLISDAFWDEHHLTKTDNISYIDLIHILLNEKQFLMQAMVRLTYILGFTMDEVYDDYVAKNKVNYERLKEGY